MLIKKKYLMFKVLSFKNNSKKFMKTINKTSTN